MLLRMTTNPGLVLWVRDGHYAICGKARLTIGVNAVEVLKVGRRSCKAEEPVRSRSAARQSAGSRIGRLSPFVCRTAGCDGVLSEFDSAPGLETGGTLSVGKLRRESAGVKSPRCRFDAGLNRRFGRRNPEYAGVTGWRDSLMLVRVGVSLQVTEHGPEILRGVGEVGRRW